MKIFETYEQKALKANSLFLHFIEKNGSFAHAQRAIKLRDRLFYLSEIKEAPFLKTDGLGLHPVQPSVAVGQDDPIPLSVQAANLYAEVSAFSASLGQGGTAHFSNPANPKKIKVYQKGACS
ncbi:hypothetical protein CCP3SC15_1410008 [Gammaproteobacteria bacterium]